jgi:hypothetical protein
MVTSTIAFTVCGIGIAGMIAAQIKIVRLRRVRASQTEVNRLIAFWYIAIIGVGVAEFVGLGTLSQTSSSTYTWSYVWTLVATNGILTVFAILYLFLHFRRVRTATEQRGEHLLTRRGSCVVAVPPLEALQWAKLALSPLDPFNVKMDTDQLRLSAETHTHWNGGGYDVTVEADKKPDGNTDIEVIACPIAEFVTHDFGAVQFFVDTIIDGIKEISEDPPEPETPEGEVRRVLTEVALAPTIPQSIKLDAETAGDLLDSGHTTEAATATQQVVDAVRSLSPMDPARRITERNIDALIGELAASSPIAQQGD